MAIKIAQLILTPGKNARSASDCFVAEVDAYKENLAGKLFMLIELPENSAENVKIINYLIDTLAHNYYQNEKILLRERISTLKVEHIFEAALAKTNKNFNDYLNSAKIKFDYGSMSVSAGVIHEKVLYLTSTCKNKAFLVYKKHNSDLNRLDLNDENSGYKIIDIVKEAGALHSSCEEHGEHKLFSDVISGEMPPQSFFFITNEALSEYLSKKQIIDTISVLPPVGAVEQFKQILSNINSYISFSGIIIKNSEAVVAIAQKVESQTRLSSDQDSIVNLSATEDATEQLLSPSGLVNSKSLGLFFKKLLLLIPLPVKNKKNSSLRFKDSVYISSRNRFLGSMKIAEVFKNIIALIINALAYFIKALKIKNLSNLPSLAKNSVVTHLLFLPRGFRALNVKSKSLLILAVLAIVILAINISQKSKDKEDTIAIENFNNIKTEIEQKQDQAEANMLFSNEEGAKKLYDEIRALIDQLPQKTDEQTAEFKAFDEKYNLFLEKLRNITRLDESEQIINLNDLVATAATENIVLSGDKKTIYAADSSQKSVYQIDIQEKIATSLLDLELPITSLLYPILSESGSIYYYNEKSTITALNTLDNNLENFPINFSSAEISGGEMFNNRFYFLDKKNGQILRYDFSNRAFSSPNNWLSKPTSLQKPVSMTIDGNIYILDENGSVVKYLRGQAVDFKLEAVEPPIEQATKIHVSRENDYIYVFEAKNSRIITYDKNGQFVMQYQGNDFKDLKDFAIDETNKIIYLLNGNTIYKYALVHIK